MICLWDKIVKKKKKLEFINIIIERKKNAQRKNTTYINVGIYYLLKTNQSKKY